MPANPTHKNSKAQNRILQHLLANDYGVISSELKPVVLAKGAPLLEADQHNDYIYFPTDSVISFLGDTGEGGTIEVWAVGNEGAAGVSAILGATKPFRAVVQVAGGALMAKTSSFRRQFQKGGSFHDAVLSYYDFLLVQISYIGICNNCHPVEQRFSRWLLMIQDRVRTRELRFTQDAIAAVLGTRRATISVAAASLQSAGFINYTPGSITITSRKGLEKRACRCYKVIRSLLRK